MQGKHRWKCGGLPAANSRKSTPPRRQLRTVDRDLSPRRRVPAGWRQFAKPAFRPRSAAARSRCGSVAEPRRRGGPCGDRRLGWPTSRRGPMKHLKHKSPLPPLAWPTKRDLFGIGVSLTTYRGTVRTILEAARRHEPAIVSFYAVHAVVETSTKPSLLGKVNRFQIVAPDGQPVRWALNWLHGAHLPASRLRAGHDAWPYAARRQRPGWRSSSTAVRATVIEPLQANLQRRFPSLRIAGAISPPFRPSVARRR